MSLPTSDVQALKPHLELMKFEQHKVLVEAGDAIECVYFPTGSSSFRPSSFAANAAAANLYDRAAERNFSIKANRGTDNAISSNHRRSPGAATMRLL